MLAVPPIVLLVQEHNSITQPLQRACVSDGLHHLGQHRRLAPVLVINSRAVGHKAIGGHEAEQVIDDVACMACEAEHMVRGRRDERACGVRHAAAQQAEDDKVGVPVIYFSKASTGNNDGVG